MKNTEQKKNSKYVKILIVILVSIVFYAIMNNLGKVGELLSIVSAAFSPIFIGLALAFVFNIPLRFFEEKVFKKLTAKNGKVWSKLKRPLCITISILCILALITIILSFVIPEFIRTCTRFFISLPDNMQKLEAWIQETAAHFHLPVDSNSIKLDWDSISAAALDFISENSGSLTQSAILVATGFITGVVNFAIGLVLAIYILASKEALGKLVKSFIYSVMKRDNAKKFISVVLLSNKAFAGFISGQCVECLLIGSLCFVGMLIFQFPYPLMVSCIIGFTAFIPVFGSIVGALIGGLLIFIVDPMLAIWFLIYILVLQQIESNVLYPRIMGKHVGLPGLWVLSAVTVGGGLFGVLGVVISVPLCGVLYTLFEKWIIKRLEERNICHRSMSHDSSEPKSIIEDIESFEFEEEFSDDHYTKLLDDVFPVDTPTEQEEESADSSTDQE